MASDETWHFHEGDPIELLVADRDFDRVDVHRVGPVNGEAHLVGVVRAGLWQAARCTGAYALVSCAVGPGFDFADFEMLSRRPDVAERLVRRHPHLASLV